MLVMAIAIPLAFLSGSVPFGLLIARSKGVDIRAHGSGNIGATNVWRVLGRGPGLACFGLDMAKGLIPTLAAGLAGGVLGRADMPAGMAWLWLGTVAASIAGHMYSPWIGFKGGKGVATGFGALLGVYPLLTWPALGALAAWLLVAKISRYVSLASCIAAVLLPVWLAATVEVVGRGPGRHAAALPFYLVVGLLAAVVVAKHRANLRRLWRGTENRIGQRVHASPTGPGPGPGGGDTAGVP
ncbi:MAG: glycerol-3-phosphate 1-O-acyltransferase PlsY [Phycisphaerales bacterium]|nr:glycerol-3-phosphate 1-O-acyltransferase PlsY [Phycisphaerales bacterium]